LWLWLWLQLSCTWGHYQSYCKEHNSGKGLGNTV